MLQHPDGPLCRNKFAKAIWIVWPAWVWFAVMATGNHFWLDVVGGIVVAAIAMAIIRWQQPAGEPAPDSASAPALS